MIFEIGKQYIVSVTENRIIPIEEFSKERYFDIEHDSIDFLTDEEKVVIINDVLDKIKAEIEECKQYRGMTGNPAIDKHNVGLDKYYDLGLEKAIKIIDKYKTESEEGAKE